MSSGRRNISGGKKIILGITVLLLFAIFWGYYNIWRSPKYYLETNSCEEFQAILSMQQYGLLTSKHERPYIIQIEDVVIFGSEHSKDSKHQQNKAIENIFNEFNPTVVLVEGRLGFLIPHIMDPVRQFGEMGKAAQLAKKNNVSLYSWDAPKSELLAKLLGDFDAEQLALKEILTPYFSSLRYGKPASPEKYIEQYLNRASWLGVQDKFKSLDDIDRIWQRDFSDEKDWRETSDEWSLPGYLADIADSSNWIRNQHLVCSINKLREQNEKVLVICGSSHAVCIENEIY